MNNNNAKFAFFYALAAISLAFMAIAVGLVAFFVIDKEIADVLVRNNYYSTSQLRFAISALIISAPIFYLVSNQIYGSLRRGTLILESAIRKWLTYVILLAASVVALGWLISIINSFLDGELTNRFIAKAITAIIISLAVFTFYLLDVRREKLTKGSSLTLKIYSVISIVIVVAVFVTAIFFVESPALVRAKKVDQRIVGNFYSLNGLINSYYFENNVLPKDFAELRGHDTELYTPEHIFIDPETEEDFGYEVLGEKEYQVCADFRTSNMENDDFREYSNMRHEAGWQCLKHEVRDIKKI